MAGKNILKLIQNAEVIKSERTGVQSGETRKTTRRGGMLVNSFHRRGSAKLHLWQ